MSYPRLKNIEQKQSVTLGTHINHRLYLKIHVSITVFNGIAMILYENLLQYKSWGGCLVGVDPFDFALVDTIPRSRTISALCSVLHVVYELFAQPFLEQKNSASFVQFIIKSRFLFKFYSQNSTTIRMLGHSGGPACRTLSNSISKLAPQ